MWMQCGPTRRLSFAMRLNFEEHFSEATNMLTELRLQTPPSVLSSIDRK
jgi:hypothetical protein